jgi:hypothetical protein
VSFRPELSARLERSRSYLFQLERALLKEFPVNFPIYFGEQNSPQMDVPTRVVWYPVIGEIKEPETGAYSERFDADGNVVDPDEPDAPNLESVTREIVAERHLNLAFDIWGADSIEADLLVNAVYAKVKRVVPRVIRAQEQWRADDQQTTLGRLVTLLISVPVPVADDDAETAEVLASVVARVQGFLMTGEQVNSELETPPVPLIP